MTINSMTGFGKGESKGENYTVTVEIKSVNNRFKDLRFKMSNYFNSSEITLRKKIDEKFRRGSFDIFVNYKKNPELEKTNEIDFLKIENYLTKMKEVTDKVKVSMQVTPTEFMRSDFYTDDDSKIDELQSLMMNSFDLAANALLESRVEEGEKLIEKLKEHKSDYEDHYKKIPALKDTYQDSVREKLTKRFDAEGSNLSVDEGRFNQELIYYLEKLDIEEEITRIDGHLVKLEKLLNGKGEVGRQIDFLLQELGRETNTIGSKSGSQDISSHIVQMKVQLEKIREQALNLE